MGSNRFLNDLEIIDPDTLDLSFDSGDEQDGSPSKQWSSGKLIKWEPKENSNIGENINDSLDLKDIQVKVK